MKTDVKEIERRIYFYRLDVGRDESGNAIPFSPVRVFQSIITNFPFPARYLEGADEVDTACWVDSTAMPLRVRMAVVRRSALPSIDDRSGSLNPLEIPIHKGVAEVSHAVFFSDNIMGLEFNFYGPRIGRWKEYLRSKGGPGASTLEIHALLRQDIMPKLGALQEITRFTLKIQRSYVSIVREADESLGAAFAAAATVGQADNVELILGPAKYSRTGALSQKLLEVVGILARREDFRTEAGRFEVSGRSENGRRIDVDLLSDHLAATRKMLRLTPRSRAVEYSSAYASIIDAYAQHKDELLTAAGIVV